MKKLVCIVCFFYVGLSLSAQSNIIIYDNPQNDDAWSYTLNMGTSAVISFVSQYNAGGTENFTFQTCKYLISQDGAVINFIDEDSSDTYGYSNSFNVMAQNDTTIFHFGGLFKYKTREFRMIIRKTDTNLNLIRDTIYNLGNSIIYFLDVVKDSSCFILSGGTYSADSTFYAFLLKVDTNMQIVDSVFFPLPYSNNFGSAIYLFTSGDLQMRLSSAFHKVDLLLSFDRDSLQLLDTLFSFGLGNDPINKVTNCYATPINDSIYLTPVEFWNATPDTVYQNVGWLKWHRDGYLLDTLLPLNDSLFADILGVRKTSLHFNDTIAMAFTHNCSYQISPYLDSTEVALILCDDQGNLKKMFSVGFGYHFTVENLLRFDNGNFLITARRSILLQVNPNQTIGFVAWLLNRNGELIQTIELPVKPEINLRFFPNPTTDYLTLQTKDNTSLPQGTLQIFNMQGALQMELAIPKHQSQVQLNLSHLPAGLYLGRIVGRNGDGGGFRFVKE